MQQPDSADTIRRVQEVIHAACAPQAQSGASGLFAESQLADVVRLAGMVASDGAYESVPEAMRSKTARFGGQ